MNATEITTATDLVTYSDGTTTRRFMVEADGTVRAYDAVAGHYTTCHSLRPGQLRYLRSLAAKAQ